MESKPLGAAISLAVFPALAIWGILLISGRGYRTIAGNRKSSDSQIEEERNDGLGRAIGVVLVGGATICAFEAVAMLF